MANKFGIIDKVVERKKINLRMQSVQIDRDDVNNLIIPEDARINQSQRLQGKKVDGEIGVND